MEIQLLSEIPPEILNMPFDDKETQFERLIEDQNKKSIELNIICKHPLKYQSHKNKQQICVLIKKFSRVFAEGFDLIQTGDSVIKGKDKLFKISKLIFPSPPVSAPASSETLTEGQKAGVLSLFPRENPQINQQIKLIPVPTEILDMPFESTKEKHSMIKTLIENQSKNLKDNEYYELIYSKRSVRFYSILYQIRGYK